jgi:inner membrane protein
MASELTHFVVGASLAVPLTAVGRVSGSLRPVAVVLAAGALGALPDLDAVLLWRGAQPGLLSHRGITHAPFVLGLFCLTVAVCLGLLVRRLPAGGVALLGVAWALAAVSHPLLDGLTNGGPGVMLLYPFSEERLFLPWRPIEVAPLAVSRFPRAASRVLSSELPFCLGALLLAVLGHMLVTGAVRPSKQQTGRPDYGLG